MSTVYVYASSTPLEPQLDRIERMLAAVLRGNANERIELDALQTAVSASTDIQNSTVLLIQGIADRIAEAANDPAAMTALSAALKSSTDTLAAAVTANT